MSDRDTNTFDSVQASESRKRVPNPPQAPTWPGSCSCVLPEDVWHDNAQQLLREAKAIVTIATSSRFQAAPAAAPCRRAAYGDRRGPKHTPRHASLRIFGVRSAAGVLRGLMNIGIGKARQSAEV